MREINVYKYEELTEDAKKIALTNNRETNIFDGWWEDVMDDFHNYVWDTYGVDIPLEGIRFSGFYSQGDGASFEIYFGPQELESLLKKLGYKFKNKNLKDFILDEVEVSIERTSYEYCHEETVHAFVRADEEETKEVEDDLWEIEDTIERWKNEMCSLLYSMLQDEYEYRTSDEAIEEDLISNDYEFLEDGRNY